MKKTHYIVFYFILFFAKKLIVEWKSSSKRKKIFTGQPATQNGTLHEELRVTQPSRNILTFRKRYGFHLKAEKFFFNEDRSSTSFKNSVNFYEPTRRHNPEESDFQF